MGGLVVSGARVLGIWLTLAVSCLAASVSLAAERVALVIGNGSYDHVAPLLNVPNDRADVAKALRDRGYAVTEIADASRAELTDALASFARTASRAETAVVYYAGHGIEVDGTNYFVPSSARLVTGDDVEFETVEVELAIRAVSRASELSLVILDACRNNPFKIAAAGRSIGRGLARPSVPRGRNTLVAFAASEGEVASDGDGRNSPFTQALLATLAEEPVEVRRFFGKVRDRVLSSTQLGQEPAIYAKLGGDAYYLTDPPARPKVPSGGEQVAIAPPPRTERYLDLSTFRDCPECPEMVVIPPGSFRMGSPPGEAGRRDNEGPQHRRQIAKFALAKTEVTFDQWAACVKDGGCRSNPNPSDVGWGRGTRPVITVSWDHAQEYVGWLNGKVEGEPYRLPSEAEWEYAARAGTTTPFAFGATISTDRANYDGNYTYGSGRAGVYRQRTVPVDDLDAANAWGLRHMHGNVWEWAEDCWHDSYAGAPSDGWAWTSSQNGDCSRRVLRGGSWFIFPRFLRSAIRNWLEPEVRGRGVGFRPARTLTP